MFTSWGLTWRRPPVAARWTPCGHPAASVFLSFGRRELRADCRGAQGRSGEAELTGLSLTFRDYVAGGTVIVTGANTGIGKQTALELARRARRRPGTSAGRPSITVSSARHLDLASLKSIREFPAARVLTCLPEEERVDVMVNTAAVMRCPHWTTEDGFEMQFGVNYLGHFLLTHLLLDKLRASAPARIINLSSLAHVAGHVDLEDLNWQRRKYDTKAAYCQSKLALVLFTKELSRRLPGTGVTVNALHPGVARTELGHWCPRVCGLSALWLLAGPIFWLLVKSPQLAAQPSTYLAVAEELEGVSGKYFDGFKEKAPAPEAEDEELACRLWAESARLVGLDLSHGSPVRGQSLSR
uniref:Retinol dehydrogenase 13 n=1 Tax=Sciurus vulgaris TaxID=55149 RepID=A0A8D2JQU2_SCIVU